MSEGQRRKGLAHYLGLTAGVGIVASLAAYFVPREAMDRLAALVGVGAAVASGAGALWLKARVVKQSVNAALKAMGWVFLGRLVMVSVGLGLSIRWGGSPIAFTAGFFGVYFVQQWIEISFVLAEQEHG